jgi:hypothetical protein
MISCRGARRGFLRSHHVAYGSAVRPGWRNAILWEPAVYECRVGVDSGVETLSGGRRPGPVSDPTADRLLISGRPPPRMGDADLR